MANNTNDAYRQAVEGIDPYTDAPYHDMESEPVHISDPRANDFSRRPFSLGDPMPAYGVFDPDSLLTLEDILGENSIPAARHMEEFRLRSKKTKGYGEMFRDYLNMKAVGFKPEVQEVQNIIDGALSGAFVPTLETKHQRSPLDAGVQKTSVTFTLDYVSAIASMSGIRPMLPNTIAPNGETICHPRDLLHWLKDKYLTPQMDLDKKYVHFGKDSSHEIFIAFRPVHRPSRSTRRQDKIEEFQCLGKKRLEPISKHHRTAWLVFLASFLDRVSDLVYANPSLPEKGESSTEWTHDDLVEYTNILGFKAVPLKHSQLNRHTDTFLHLYRDFARHYFTLFDDSFWVDHEPIVILTKYGQDFTIYPEGVSDDREAREHSAFFQNHFLYWQGMEVVCLALATTHPFLWHKKLHMLPRDEWKLNGEPFSSLRRVYKYTPSQWQEMASVHDFDDDDDDDDDDRQEEQPPMSETDISNHFSKINLKGPEELAYLYNFSGARITWLTSNTPAKEAQGAGLVNVKTISGIFAGEIAPINDQELGEGGGVRIPRKPPIVGYTPAYQRELGNIQAAGAPAHVRTVIKDIMDELVPDYPPEDPWLYATHTQIYNNVAHVMKGASHLIETGHGHVTAVAVGAAMGGTSFLGKKAQVYQRLLRSVEEKLPHERLNEKILVSRKKELRAEYNIVCDLSLARELSKDTDIVFDGETIFTQIISPLCQALDYEYEDGSKFYAEFFKHVTVLPGHLFPNIIVASTAYVGGALAGIFKLGVLNKKPQEIHFAIPDMLAALERVIHFGYTGAARSLMNYGSLFGMIESLRKGLLPSFTKGIRFQGTASRRFYQYQEGEWPVSETTELLIMPSLSTCVHFYKEHSTQIYIQRQNALAKIAYVGLAKDPEQELHLRTKVFQYVTNLVIAETMQWAEDMIRDRIASEEAGHTPYTLDLRKTSLVKWVSNSHPFSYIQNSFELGVALCGDEVRLKNIRNGGPSPTIPWAGPPGISIGYIKLAERMVDASLAERRKDSPPFSSKSVAKTTIKRVYKAFTTGVSGVAMIPLTKEIFAESLAVSLKSSYIQIWPWSKMHADSRGKFIYGKPSTAAWIAVGPSQADLEKMTTLQGRPLSAQEELTVVKRASKEANLMEPYHITNIEMKKISIVYQKYVTPVEWSIQNGGNLEGPFGRLVQWAFRRFPPGQLPAESELFQDCAAMALCLLGFVNDLAIPLRSEFSCDAGAAPMLECRNGVQATEFLRQIDYHVTKNLKGHTRLNSHERRWVSYTVYFLGHVFRDAPTPFGNTPKSGLAKTNPREDSIATAAGKFGITNRHLVKVGILAIDDRVLIIPDKVKEQNSHMDPKYSVRAERRAELAINPTSENWLEEYLLTFCSKGDIRKLLGKDSLGALDDSTSLSIINKEKRQAIEQEGIRDYLNNGYHYLETLSIKAHRQMNGHLTKKRRRVEEEEEEEEEEDAWDQMDSEV